MPSPTKLQSRLIQVASEIYDVLYFPEDGVMTIVGPLPKSGGASSVVNVDQPRPIESLDDAVKIARQLLEPKGY